MHRLLWLSFPGIRVVNSGHKWPIVGSWKRLGQPTARFWACCGCTVLPRRCTASESGVGDGGYAAVRCISTDQRVKARSCMQCYNVSVSAPPPFDQRRLHDKDVLALSLQQQSFYLLNRRLGTERRRPRPAKFSLCISRFLGTSILQRLLILLDFTSSRTYPLHRPHLCYALSTGALLISDAPLYLSVNYCGLRAVFDHVPIRSLGP